MALLIADDGYWLLFYNTLLLSAVLIKTIVTYFSKQDQCYTENLADVQDMISK